MPAKWPWEVQAEKVPQPNREERRAILQKQKRQQRRGQRAYNRSMKSADNAKAE